LNAFINYFNYSFKIVYLRVHHRHFIRAYAAAALDGYGSFVFRGMKLSPQQRTHASVILSGTDTKHTADNAKMCRPDYERRCEGIKILFANLNG
jgi:hypothetical protein